MYLYILIYVIYISTHAIVQKKQKLTNLSCPRQQALKEGAQQSAEGGEGVEGEGGRGAVQGGKQGWRVRDDSRQNSAHVFDTHRWKECGVSYRKSPVN